MQSKMKFMPLVVAFVAVILWTAIREINGFEFGRAMANFMGGFFLLFGAMKSANWRNFSNAFADYDPIARRSRIYAYLYPALEVGLGVAYLTGFAMLLVNLITLLVMSVGAVGISQRLKQKTKPIQCACLGGFFNIPLSGFTVFEDLLMGGMAFLMLFPHGMATMSGGVRCQVMGKSVVWFVICLTVTLFYLFRLVFGKWLLPKYDVPNEVSHGLMALAMAGMFFGQYQIASDNFWLWVFWLISAWYLACVMFLRKYLRDKRLRGYLIHFFMAAGMVYMLKIEWANSFLTYGFALFFGVFTVWYLSVEIVADWRAKPRNMLWVLGDVAHATMGWGMAYMLLR